MDLWGTSKDERDAVAHYKYGENVSRVTLTSGLFMTVWFWSGDSITVNEYQYAATKRAMRGEGFVFRNQYGIAR